MTLPKLRCPNAAQCPKNDESACPGTSLQTTGIGVLVLLQVRLYIGNRAPRWVTHANLGESRYSFIRRISADIVRQTAFQSGPESRRVAAVKIATACSTFNPVEIPREPDAVVEPAKGRRRSQSIPSTSGAANTSDNVSPTRLAPPEYAWRQYKS